MKILENLKLDTWYGLILYIGVLMMAASLFFNVDFIQKKHLFGLGLGFLFIGLSFLIAEKHQNTIKPPNFYTGQAALISWKVIKHNPFTIIILIIGVGLTVLFGFLLVKNLI